MKRRIRRGREREMKIKERDGEMQTEYGERE